MINLSIVISDSEIITGPGGLFDFDATLPLVAIQFILLMLILNAILFSPLLTIIEDRNEFILTNLAKASEMLTQANTMTTQYQDELSNVRKEAQLEIANSQKIHKEIFEIELNTSQTYIDNLLDRAIKQLSEKQNKAINNLDTNVKSLCLEIENQLSI
jgi:F-type H+-transporting ATPase subunit b